MASEPTRRLGAVRHALPPVPSPRLTRELRLEEALPMGSQREVPARYLNRLVASSTGPRLLAARVFPDAKEVTESFGARQAIAHVSGLDPRDSSVMLVSVGDGTTPRTAATFALTTAWQCHAVDPRLRAKATWNRIPRLTCHRVRVEEVELQADTVVVAMVHAHVEASAALASIRARRVVVIAMPCCVPVGLPVEPVVRYRDRFIGSPSNEIAIWVNPHCPQTAATGSWDQ
jgi:hypothetical protein